MKKNLLFKQLLSSICFFIFFITASMVTSAADLYVATTGSDILGDGTSGNPWKTIQHAVVTSISGDVIHVAAGTYVEVGQIVIDKNLSIVGADKATTIIQTNQNTDNTGSGRGWFLVNAGFTFNMSNVTLDGTVFKIWQGIRDLGQGLINNCSIKNIQYEAGGPSYAGTGIVAFGATGMNVNVTNCDFSAIGRVGVLFYGTGITGSTYSGNTYTGKGGGNWLDYGVEVGAGAVATIQTSTITANTGIATVDGSTSAGILVTTYNGAGTTATILNNFVNSNTSGIAVGFDGADASTVTAHENDLSGNSTYAIISTAATVNATCNWYGTADALVIASKISGPVNYTPWLTNGTDASGDPGFQPVSGSCNGSALFVNDGFRTGDIYTLAIGNDLNPGTAALPFATIQHAIDIASAGATIYVDAGTYIENILVNKEVTLYGAGQALSFVKPAISGPTCGSSSASLCAGGSNIMLVQANNVTITNFTLDGDNPKLKSGVKIGGADIDARNGIITNHNAGVYTNLNVNHVTVKNIYLRGIYASSGGSFTFTNNTVSNVQGSTSSVAMFNYGGAGTFANNNVSNANDAISSNYSMGCEYYGNTVTSSGSGIHTDNNGGGTADKIHNNKVSNSTGKGYGIWVFATSLAVSIDADTVTNVNVGLANFAQSAGVTPTFTNNSIDGQNKANCIGIYQTSDELGYGFTSVSGSYTNNFIANNAVGVSLEYYANTINTITVNSNSITGNKIGVKLATGIKGAGILENNFDCNWWGTATSAGVKKAVGANVDYTPWLGSSNDGSTAAGFQPTAPCTVDAALRTYVSGSTDVAIANPNYKPVAFALSNFPNPFAGTSTIKYDLPFDSKVSIKVYDLMGRVVTTLVEADKKAGTYTVVFNAGSFTKGSLYYRIVAKSKDKQFEQTNKMIQLK